MLQWGIRSTKHQGSGYSVGTRQESRAHRRLQQPAWRSIKFASWHDMRYLADAPLRSLRADLGLVDPSSHASIVAKAAPSRVPLGLIAKLAGLEDTLNRLTDTVSRHATELARAQIAAASTTAPTRYIQNTTPAAVHAIRANNEAQTVCGKSL